jgi:transposase
MGAAKKPIHKLSRQVVKRSGQRGEGVAQVAPDRGLRPGVLRQGKRETGPARPEPLNGRGVAPEKDVEQLRRELQRVTWELDFLKEAAAFFVKTRSGFR